MATLSRPILFYGIVMIQIFTAASERIKQPSMIEAKAVSSGDRLMGITSVAEVASKDGKVSSTGGVKFYPPIGKKLNKNSNIMQPWTFSTKSNDGFAMGAVQIYPGTVVASAASYGNPKSGFGQMNPIVNWPMPDNYFPRTFTSGIHKKPLFPNYMFKNFDPLTPVTPDFNDAWFRPIYDPFIDIWQR